MMDVDGCWWPPSNWAIHRWTLVDPDMYWAEICIPIYSLFLWLIVMSQHVGIGISKLLGLPGHSILFECIQGISHGVCLFSVLEKIVFSILGASRIDCIWMSWLRRLPSNKLGLKAASTLPVVMVRGKICFREREREISIGHFYPVSFREFPFLFRVQNLRR